MLENYKPGFIEKLNSFFTKCRLPFKLTFILIGVASTVWFLIKVIPKPSRATYPCMQAAAPIMSGFIIWLIGLAGSAFTFKKAKKLFKKAKFLPGLVMACIAIVFCIMLSLKTSKHSAATPLIVTAEHEANNPIGEAQGIFPGRVVWTWNPAATNENCTNSWGIRTDSTDDDGYFLPKNNDQSVIDSMVKYSVLNLTGETTVEDAWNALFIYHNQKKDKGEEAYSPEETIFIKINQGSGDWMSDPSDLSVSTDNDWRAVYYGITETLPQLILSVLKQLVDSCGVPQNKIYLGDPRSHIFKHTYDYLSAVYPDVNYFDKSYSTLGRTLSAGQGSNVLTYSDKGTVMSQAVTDYLYKEMEDADYLINMACLKGHQRAGITLTAKNHFGSHTRASAAHLHAGLVWVDDADWEGNEDLWRTQYGLYRVQVDIMSYEDLGQNTMLFMVDGLWGGPEAVMTPVKWRITPFDNDFPSSLFISQDQVALESVCFDFLRTEFTEANHPGLAFPNYPAADDYLHQAADSSSWPDGIIYDPENDGTSFKSLGIHEHWNDPARKQYSQNLGLDYGIELYAPGIVNFSPQLLNPTGDIVIHKNSKPVYLVTDLRNEFYDPDGDDLSFIVDPSNSDDVDAILVGDTAVIIQSGNNFTGLSEITITASDSKEDIRETIHIKVVDETQMTALRADEAIVFDGSAGENIWKNSRWYYIDQVWIPYRADLPAEDFSGRYKVAWSADSNLLYFFAETYDDAFVDGYVYRSDPSNNNYPDYDILEVFIDEDKSGGKHVFDDGADWGTNAENAFSYHYSISLPSDGGTTSSVVACDIAGTDWGSYTIPNYANHLENFIVKRNGNTLSWEFSLKVYSDAYNAANPEASRVTLITGKQIGLSLAYCDNDDPNEEPKTRDNFIGSDVGPDQQLTQWNDHWMNASVYGNLKLDDDQPNRSPEVIGTISDINIFADDTPHPVNPSLDEIFHDPDGDQLIYSGFSDNEDITVEIINDTVFVSAASDIILVDNPIITIGSSDGDFIVSTQFTVFIIVDKVTDLIKLEYIDIWPNPASSKLNIKIQNNLNGLVDIQITDLSGKLISRQFILKINPTEEYFIDLNDLYPGIYVIQVSQGLYKTTKKIIYQ
jgi:hypothetical protein